MKFKMIQESEMRRLLLLLRSEDKEMRNLGISILNKPEKIRFSFATIFYFNILLTCSTLTLIIYGLYHGIGWYALPLLIAWIFQVIVQLASMDVLSEERKEYNALSKGVKSWIENV